MHEDLKNQSNSNYKSNFNNFRIGLKMERAVVMIRLRILGGYILEGLAPLAGVPIPPKIEDHGFEYGSLSAED